MPAASRPSTALSAQDVAAATKLPELIIAAQEETEHPDDKFQAQVCVGWLHWVVGEYGLASTRLPKLPEPTSGSETWESMSSWTRLCAIKST